MNNALLHLFALCLNQYPNSAFLATPMTGKASATIVKSLDHTRVII